MYAEECYRVIEVCQIINDKCTISQIISNVNFVISRLFNRTCWNGINREIMIERQNMIVNSVIFLPMIRVDYGCINEEFMRKLSRTNVLNVFQVIKLSTDWQFICYENIILFTNINKWTSTLHIPRDRIDLPSKNCDKSTKWKHIEQNLNLCSKSLEQKYI